jgi:hypothetical protein
MIRKFCLWLCKRLPHVTIYVPDPVTGIRAPYLTRYYLFGSDRKWGNIFLHQFHDGDKGDELHNHPWKWSFGLALAGGYLEERRSLNDNIELKVVSPGTINFINNKIFHRVDLLEHDAWTLFFAGPRSKDWGFWNKQTKQYRDWRTNPDAIE